MASVKDLIVKPISSSDARGFIKRNHYSGKVVNNSTLHFGVFWDGKCEGVMQFGSPMKKSPILPIVKNTKWNGMLELNRMAFSDELPKNSESRALSVAFRLIKQHYPHIKWILTFADGCQCGDGTIYRAAGFKLIGIKVNNQLRINPKNGNSMHTISAYHIGIIKEFRKWQALKGYQLKYIRFLDKSCEKDLTIPVIPFSKITEMGANMYKGEKTTRRLIEDCQVPPDNGGASPTSTLQTKVTL